MALDRTAVFCKRGERELLISSSIRLKRRGNSIYMHSLYQINNRSEGKLSYDQSNDRSADIKKYLTDLRDPEHSVCQEPNTAGVRQHFSDRDLG